MARARCAEVIANQIVSHYPITGKQGGARNTLMRFTLRLFSRNAAASGLLALLSLAAHSQASKPETHGTVLANIVVENMDRSVKPGDDFFRYANGEWIKRTEIPNGSGYFAIEGWSNGATDSTRKQIAALIEEAIKANAPAGSDTRKISDFYGSFMDETAIEAKGLAPLHPHLKAIAAIRDKRTLARALGETLRSDVDPMDGNFHTANLFGLSAAPGLNDPEHYMPYLVQGGLDLPEREYYLSDSPEMVGLRSKYHAHVATMLRLAGFNDADARAEHIVELEHAIAKTHVAFADEQDLHTANNTWKQADFAANAPGLDWAEYFRGAGLSQQASFIVWQPTAFTGESALVASVPLDTWKDWLAFHLIDTYAAVLPKAFADERFALFGRAISGRMDQAPPRAQRAISLINNPYDETANALLEGRGVLGFAVGKMYARLYFSPQTKAQVESMVANLIAAFRRRIDALSWMDPATRAEAKAKLDTLYVGVGSPDTWRDYSAYEVKADDIFGNLWRGSLFDYHRDVARLGHPVDRKEWIMTPQTADANQLTLQNAITLPAALFQAPFFDPQATAAANYGALGAFMGHEISHTFDAEGSAVDSTGRLRNWWTPDDLAHFNAAAASLVAQYDAYKPLSGLAVNGKQTLNENIADLGGLAAAYDAYHASLAGKTAPVVNGFSGDQQFFLAFAYLWCDKSSEAYLRAKVLTDEHSPDEFRVATVRNLDAWYAAFNVQPGDKLYLAPSDRVRIW